MRGLDVHETERCRPPWAAMLAGAGLWLCLALMMGGTTAMAEQQGIRDVYSDTWVATDALGRALPPVEETGPPRPDRTVAMFYFLWLGMHGQTGPHDISRILAANPDAMSQPGNPAWGPLHAYHHWGEPLFGYYVSTDPYVYRKHAEMLADAGVDVIVFDVTNQTTYKDSYMTLCRVFSEARKDGVAAPAIAFLCPFGNADKVVREVHNDLYGPGLYADLWFRWDGKPLILADPATVTSPELREFFTFRKPMPSYFAGPSGPDQWGWLEVYPQHVFRNSAGDAEQVCVGVAQNAVGDRLGSMSEKGARGRSFPSTGPVTRPDAVRWGYNFAEQWQRALEVDPRVIFLTGWNEWIAMRLPEFAGIREPVMFVDTFSQECSRDIEPMKGGHGDDYYYQTVGFIRRYKGARPQPRASAPVTIDLDGPFDQWAGVGPEFLSHAGSTVHRNHPGWGAAGPYVNATGRNDLVAARVARDATHLYFQVRTAQPITPPEGPRWMTLFLDTDRNAATGWEGYDYVVNRLAPEAGRARLERSTGGWAWEAVTDVPFRVEGNQLHLAIPREALALAGKPLDIAFKWADNFDGEGDILAFWDSGDAAPPGRFSYRYYE